jgi:hypothetical protein
MCPKQSMPSLWSAAQLPHLAIGLDAVLQAVQLPAGITDLDAGLADVDADHLTHGCCFLMAKTDRAAVSCVCGNPGIMTCDPTKDQ